MECLLSITKKIAVFNQKRIYRQQLHIETESTYKNMQNKCALHLCQTICQKYSHKLYKYQ